LSFFSFCLAYFFPREQYEDSDDEFPTIENLSASIKKPASKKASPQKHSLPRPNKTELKAGREGKNVLAEEPIE
jgi:hypothetical protein